MRAVRSRKQSGFAEECKAAIHRKAVAAFNRRYTRANGADVTAKCTLTPEVCGNFVNIERLYMASHNTAVMADAERRIGHLNAERRQAQNEARREREAREREAEDQRRALAAVAGALQGMSAAMAASHASGGVQASASSPSCSSDYDCGYGKVCSKPAGQYQGICATSVNQYGMPQPTISRRGNLGPGER